jgi:hypothetical protein
MAVLQEWKFSWMNQVYVAISLFWLVYLIRWLAGSFETPNRMWIAALVMLKLVQSGLFMVFFILAESPNIAANLGLEFIIGLSIAMQTSLVLFNASYLYVLFTTAMGVGSNVASLPRRSVVGVFAASLTVAIGLFYVSGITAAVLLALSLIVADTMTALRLPKTTTARDRVKQTFVERYRRALQVSLGVFAITSLVIEKVFARTGYDAHRARVVVVLVTEVMHAATLSCLTTHSAGHDTHVEQVIVDKSNV